MIASLQKPEMSVYNKGSICSNSHRTSATAVISDVLAAKVGDEMRITE